MEDVASRHPEGVVLPPKDIRSIVEKTAGYVARNGPVFEDRIRQKEIKNPKFSFLLEGDAYSAFYLWRLDEIRAGRGTDVSAGRAGEAAAAAAAAASEQAKGPVEPLEFQFSARMPTINAKDLDIVRLTALFAAKNGRSFTTALTQREAGNSQFDFLRPTHSLYHFFSRLVDQYGDLLNGGTLDGGRPERKRKAELELNIRDRKHVLERAKGRAEWQKYREQQKQEKQEQEEKEKIEYAQIDWHDFVIAETIEFNEADDQQELVPPTSLNDLQSASLEQKAMRSLQPADRRIEEAMPTDEVYFDSAPSGHLGPEAAMPVQAMYAPQPGPQMAYGTPPPPPPPQPQYQPPRTAAHYEEEDAIRERAEQRERAQAAQEAARGAATGPMRIRNDYVPVGKTRKAGGQTALCPNCKQQIAMDELEQHMRIELLDPEWKKQKAKAESRHATTNLSTADVANNLKRLASQRSDVFDAVTGQQMLSAEEEARRKKQQQQMASGVVYDGQPETKAAMQGLNIEEQIRQIHQRFKQ